MTTPTAPPQTSQKPVLVVDYGAQYAQLIARRVREANVYSEIVPHTFTTEQLLAKNPAAIILSGGPSSVYAEGAPFVGADLFEAGVPVFGICYGFQAMANAWVARWPRPVCGSTVPPKHSWWVTHAPSSTESRRPRTRG